MRQRVAVAGPTSTAASAPPRRWPDVPAPTGKVTICAAKTNTATRPGERGRRGRRARAGPPRRQTGDGTGRDDRRRRPRSGRRGSRRGRARGCSCRSRGLVAHYSQQGRARAISRPRRPTSESPAGACAGTGHERCEVARRRVLLARSTIRVGGEVHGGEAARVDPHALEPASPAPTASATTGLDRVAVAHGDPDGVRRRARPRPRRRGPARRRRRGPPSRPATPAA